MDKVSSSYLTITPTSAGNLKTWSFSAWYIPTNQTIVRLFGVGTDTSGINQHSISVTSTGAVQVFLGDGVGSTIADKTTDALLRDMSSLYHIEVEWDTTQATPDDRVKIYINGNLASLSTSTNPPINQDGLINGTEEHTIGVLPVSKTNYSNIYMKEVHFVDGLALSNSDFGRLDSKTNTWVPVDAKAKINLAGGYGTTGFYLPFTPDTTNNNFSILKYTGNDVTQSIVGAGFSPDLVITKNRTGVAAGAAWSDSLRGINNWLNSSSNAAEGYDADNGISSFDADGFSLEGNWNNFNSSASTFVAWCFEAPSSTTDVTSDDKACSEKFNTELGFSIVTYQGNSTNGHVIPHSLGVVPELMIVKRRDAIGAWYVYNATIGATQYLSLNTTDEAKSIADPWFDTAPTSTGFTVSSENTVNAATAEEDLVAYLFASKAGHCKIDTYTGTGTAGNKQTLGFTPSLIMTKKTSVAGGSWNIIDNVRNESNPIDKALFADQGLGEQTNDAIEFLVDGFQFTTGLSGYNDSGETFIYIAFADTTDLGDVGQDQSGNNNHLLPQGLSWDDVVNMSFKNKYATLNPIFQSVQGLSGGGLEVTGTATVYSSGVSTIAITSGMKVYWETMALEWAGGSSFTIGVVLGTYPSGNPVTYLSGMQGGGNTYINGVLDTTIGSFALDDLVGCAFDYDAGTLDIYVNDVLLGTITGIDNTNNEVYFALLSLYTTTESGWINFGQKDFRYTPPTGYKELCTKNLPCPVIQDPSQHFTTVLYAGDGLDKSIIDVGFQPDMIWTKGRTTTNLPRIFDSVRGMSAGDQNLCTNNTEAEGYIGSMGLIPTPVGWDFDTDVGSHNEPNWETEPSYVAWCFKMSTVFDGTTNGGKAYTGKSNALAGMSIVGYEGNGATGHQIPHNLGATPELVIVKNRDSATAKDWAVGSLYLGGSNWKLHLNDTSLKISDSTYWGTLPTSSYVDLGSNGNTNENLKNHIMYCFRSIEGFSKVDKYMGNGNVDGTFVNCGFRPALVLIKRVTNNGAGTASNWVMIDNIRTPNNVAGNELIVNDNAIEQTIDRLDFVSNGFKLRHASAGSDVNANGEEYIYFAIAEAPQKWANAR